jgi:tripartite ATP-independent transporter DctM subunit
MTIILIFLFIALLTIGIPISFVIGIVSLVGLATIPNLSNMVIFMKMFNSLNSFVLLAVPLFILAANLMNSGKISKMLIDWCIAIVGPVKGGLAHANILVSMIFAGVSGSAQADTAGVGKVLIPNMEETGYDKETAVGVTAASSTIGVIIPPSITMVIYCGLTNVSVAAVFIAGLLPGILVGLAQMFVVMLYSKKRNYPSYAKLSLKTIAKRTLQTFPALLTPLIIIGGIITGWYTPTEAAAFACIYALFIGMFIYRTITVKSLPEIITETLKLSCLSLFAFTTASALGELLAFHNFSQHAADFFNMNIGSTAIFLLVVVAFYLFLGTFMDAVPAMILFVPVIFLPALSYGISPIHLGIIIVITLAIGAVTPPYGLCLLIACSISKLSIERGIKGALPYLLAEFTVLILIVFFPGICLWIPKLLFPELI